MGSYTDFSINGYNVFNDKNSVNCNVLSFFTEDMRIDVVEDESRIIKYVIESSIFAK